VVVAGIVECNFELVERTALELGEVAACLAVESPVVAELCSYIAEEIVELEGIVAPVLNETVVEGLALDYHNRIQHLGLPKALVQTRKVQSLVGVEKARLQAALAIEDSDSVGSVAEVVAHLLVRTWTALRIDWTLGLASFQSVEAALVVAEVCTEHNLHHDVHG